MPRGRPSNKPRSPFGKRLADARHRAGISQAELGEKLGLSQRAIAHWERRRSPLYPDQIVTLSKILNVSVNELLGIGSAKEKPGPPAKLHRQIEEVRKLPRSEQQYVSKFLEQVLERRQ